VKKTLFILITIFCSLNSFGQLKREYCFNGGFVGNCITFSLPKKLNSKYNYSIKANLESSFKSYIPAGEKMIFKIKKKKKDSIELKGNFKGARFEKYSTKTKKIIYL